MMGCKSVVKRVDGWNWVNIYKVLWMDYIDLTFFYLAISLSSAATGHDPFLSNFQTRVKAWTQAGTKLHSM